MSQVPIESVWRPQGRDLSDMGWGVFPVIDTQSGTVSSFTHTFTIPAGFNLYLTSAVLLVTPGAAQSSTLRQLVIRDRGQTETRALFSSANTALTAASSAGLLLGIAQLIPDGYDVVIFSQFNAGVASNISTASIYGTLYPRGGLRY